jgi:hypothetical protein
LSRNILKEKGLEAGKTNESNFCFFAIADLVNKVSGNLYRYCRDKMD